MTPIEQKIQEAITAAEGTDEDPAVVEARVRAQAALEAAQDLTEPRSYDTPNGPIQIDSVKLFELDETGGTLVVGYERGGLFYVGCPPYSVLKDGEPTDDPIQAIAELITARFGPMGG
jgi:hypothetical protein